MTEPLLLRLLPADPRLCLPLHCLRVLEDTRLVIAGPSIAGVADTEHLSVDTAMRQYLWRTCCVVPGMMLLTRVRVSRVVALFPSRTQSACVLSLVAVTSSSWVVVSSSDST